MKQISVNLFHGILEGEPGSRGKVVAILTIITKQIILSSQLMNGAAL
jgi:hypothetical protein